MSVAGEYSDARILIDRWPLTCRVIEGIASTKELD
jgi:hypothetical protein